MIIIILIALIILAIPAGMFLKNIMYESLGIPQFLEETQQIDDYLLRHHDKDLRMMAEQIQNNVSVTKFQKRGMMVNLLKYWLDK